MCATTTESVSCTLSKWRRDNMIDAGRRWIGIEDFAAFARDRERPRTRLITPELAAERPTVAPNRSPRRTTPANAGVNNRPPRGRL